MLNNENDLNPTSCLIMANNYKSGIYIPRVVAFINQFGDHPPNSSTRIPGSS